MPTKPTYYWHIHHDTLCEPTTDIQERIDYIKSAKPMEEIPIRLKLMTKVKHPEKLPEEWREAYQKREETYQKQEEAYQKREETYQKQEEAYQKWIEASQKQEEAYQKCLPKLEALHKKEHPNCPWNGKSIFNEE